MIVKMQRAQFPPDADVLVYDESRKFLVHMPFDKNVRKAFGKKAKIYANARINGKTLEILEVVSDQDW
jgi:hypothetical protein